MATTLAELREARLRAITRGEVDVADYVRYVELLEEVIFTSEEGSVEEAIGAIAEWVDE